MNENDSEHIAGLLLAAGWEPADSPEETDLLLINTCAVREKPVQKLYSLLGRYAWIKQKRKVRIGVVGCVAQLFRSRLLDRNPSLDFVVGPDQYDQIPRILSGLLPEKAVCTQWSREWKELPAPGIPRKSRVSASMSIMKGCNNFCSYCIVPFTRGREKYRPMDSILQEAHDLAAEGYKEIQLLGQNVNAYRDPGTGKGFPELLRALSGLEGVEWIRFITSHPQDLSLETARAMAESNKVCRQIHLPAQSGSSSVLERMNRKYTRKEYLEKITILRKEMPGISLSTDVIVGFPGETEEEFEETLSLLKTVRFTNIFSFCRAPGSQEGKAGPGPGPAEEHPGTSPPLSRGTGPESLVYREKQKESPGFLRAQRGPPSGQFPRSGGRGRPVRPSTDHPLRTVQPER